MDEYLDKEAFKKSVEERYCKPCKAEKKDHNGCWCRACWVDDMLDEVECFRGERTTFNTGAQRDMHGGKGRMDLLPWAAIIEVSKHCEAGALKYGVHNVDKGIPTSSLMDSAMRHAAKYLDGQEDEDHLLAAAWNLLWAIEMRCKKPECVDTPWRDNAEG